MLQSKYQCGDVLNRHVRTNSNALEEIKGINHNMNDL